MAEIPEKYRDPFRKKGFAHLATVGADGTPQVTPVRRRPGEVRVLYKILPERVRTMG